MPFTNSLLFSILEMVLAGSDCLHVISDGFDYFFGICMLFENSPPQKFAKLNKILLKIWKFWKRISVDQIQCGGEGNLVKTWFGFWVLPTGFVRRTFVCLLHKNIF